MPAPLLRPRASVEIIDAAIRLCRLHYLPLTTAVALVVVPVLLLELVLPADFDRVAGALQNLLLVIADAIIIGIVSDAYLGRPVELGDALRALGGRVGSLIWAAFGRGLLVAIGFVLLVVPGLVALAWTFAMPMVIVLEGMGSGDAFVRSRELARGNVGRILGTLTLAFLMVIVLLVGLGMLLGTVTDLLGLGARVDDAIGEVVFILTYPLLSVSATLLYYDLRIRKEGFDLEVMERELAAAGTAPDTRAPATAPNATRHASEPPA